MRAKQHKREKTGSTTRGFKCSLRQRRLQEQTSKICGGNTSTHYRSDACAPERTSEPKLAAAAPVMPAPAAVTVVGTAPPMTTLWEVATEGTSGNDVTDTGLRASRDLA